MKKFAIYLLAAVLLLSMTACAGSAPETEPEAPAEPADLQALYETMAEKMPEMIQLDQDMMLDYCGIAAEDCVQAVAATCADGLITDELWLIEAVSEEALERLQGLAEMRLEVKGEESISYSPEQYAVVQEAKILTSGLYMALIVSPDVDALAEICSAVIG